MKLGNNVSTIRNQGAYSDHRAKLEELGFVYESVVDVQFDVIYSALEAYKAVHGNLLMPYKFVVPEGDVRFPVETWGMKLGGNVKNIRNQGAYSEHRVKLEELGFVFKKNKKVVEIE
jgi:Fe2+ transport system protein FeoA